LVAEAGGAQAGGAQVAGAVGVRPQTLVSDCTQDALRSAVAAGGLVTFSCSGTITLTSQLVVTTGQDVTLDGTGQAVTISGGGTTRIFDVTGGSLTLTDLTLTDGLATGKSGRAGAAGAAGVDGQPGNGGNGGKPNGRPGQSGADGTVGGDAGSGVAGHDGQGGAIYVAAGATVSLTSVTVSSSTAQGGDGGSGGTGGQGGNGGGGGGGGEGGGIPAPPPTGPAPTRTAPTRTAPTRTAPTRTAPTRTAPTRTAPTRTAPTRTAPTRVGRAAATQVRREPGVAGGAISTSAAAAVPAVTPPAPGANGTPCYPGDLIEGGQPGLFSPGFGWILGGIGGGGYPPLGFNIGRGTPGTGGNGGDGGDAGAGGRAGDGGDGGDGDGGGIYNEGTLTIASSAFSADSAIGGTGGSGGDGGSAGWAGAGGGGGDSIVCVGSNGHLAERSGGNGGNAGDGAAGGDAGDGGDGGAANGGAVDNEGALTVSGTTFSGDQAAGGTGGASGQLPSAPSALYGGSAGTGSPPGRIGIAGLPGTPGEPGRAGAGGPASGGALAAAGPASVAGSTFDGALALGGSGGQGGWGGDGYVGFDGSGFSGPCTGTWLAATVCGPASDGGAGAAGAASGDGGAGGAADGGAIMASGPLTVGSTELTSCDASGGAGGAAGSAGNGGAGGDGGVGGSAATNTPVTAGSGGDAGDGGDGADGGDGGSGGTARGGGIFASGAAPQVYSTSFTDCAAAGGGGAPGAGAGDGGAGGDGGNGGMPLNATSGVGGAGGDAGDGGDGGHGGHGGDGGSARGGAIYVTDVLEDGCQVTYAGDTVTAGTAGAAGAEGTAGMAGMPGTGTPNGTAGADGNDGDPGDAGDEGIAANPDLDGSEQMIACCAGSGSTDGHHDGPAASAINVQVQTYRTSEHGDGLTSVKGSAFPVMVGEKITLEAMCQAKPVTWTIPGSSFQGQPASFVPSVVASYGDANTPTGTPPVALADYTTNPITFFLEGGNIPAGQTHQVLAITASVPDGGTATVHLDVYTPSLTTHRAATCRLDVNNQPNDKGVVVVAPAIGMGYNDSCPKTPGITWTLKGDVPGFSEAPYSGRVITGELAMSQLINTTVTKNTKTCTLYSTGGAYQADHDPLYGRSFNNVTADPSKPKVSLSTKGQADPWVSVDLPNLNDLPVATWSLTDWFRDYVMYRPHNGVWVPLGGFTWHFSGTAKVTAVKGKKNQAQLIDVPNDRPVWPGNYDGLHPKVTHFPLPYLSRAALAVTELHNIPPMPWPIWQGKPFTGPPKNSAC
jgi:hypothetical protein